MRAHSIGDQRSVQPCRIDRHRHCELNTSKKMEPRGNGWQFEADFYSLPSAVSSLL